ncbi:MAG: hypothetical protein JW958_10410 [Candidatus Eisenbacteria bacterium]|nr:hypothetical protein [Candidatus Eisenbacteria bacterium]
MRESICAVVMVVLACSGAMRNAPPRAAPSPGAGAAVEQTEERADFPFDELSRAAFDLLSESAVDSCSICAREARAEAFRILNETIRPGAALRGGGDCPFLRAPDAKNELVLSCFVHDELRLTFRFHTAASRLVGIADDDLTPDSLAALIAASPEGALFPAEIRFIPFSYGDGDAFLYHGAENRLDVPCRVTATAEE